jgi:hypothetical protein
MTRISDRVSDRNRVRLTISEVPHQHLSSFRVMVRVRVRVRVRGRVRGMVELGLGFSPTET